MFRIALRRYQSAYSGLPREVWMLAFALFVNRSGTMVLPFLTLYLTSELGLTEASAGRMLSVYGAGAILGAYLSGRLIALFGPIRVQLLCLSLCVPAFLAIPLWSDWRGVAASVFLLSLVAEAVRPANAAAITLLTTIENRTRAFALQRLAANLGFSFGPAVGGYLATIDFKLLFVVDALTTLGAAVAIFRCFWGTRLATPVPDAHKATTKASPLRDIPYLTFLALTLLNSLVFFQFLSTYPLYLRDHYALTKPEIGLMFAVNTTLIVLCEMVIVDSARDWPLLRTVAWGSFLSSIGFGILPCGTSLSYCVLSMLVITAGEMLSMPFANGFVANRSPKGGEGAYMAAYMMVLSLSWVIGPMIGATIYGVNPDAVWHCALVVALLVLAGFHALAARLESTKSHEVEPLTKPADTGA